MLQKCRNNNSPGNKVLTISVLSNWTRQHFLCCVIPSARPTPPPSLSSSSGGRCLVNWDKTFEEKKRNYISVSAHWSVNSILIFQLFSVILGGSFLMLPPVILHGADGWSLIGQQLRDNSSLFFCWCRSYGLIFIFIWVYVGCVKSFLF